MRESILLTGANGFLGSHLLLALLREQRPVICLLRSKNGQSAAERLRDALSAWCPPDLLEESCARIEVVEGQVTAPLLGLDPEGHAALRQRVTALIHCAADTAFVPEAAGAQQRANADGTEAVAQFALAAGPPCSFHLVSTAYVCGDRTGVVCEEELDRGQGFTNEYERSKLLTEKTLRRHAEERGLELTIYRPSSVVGDSITGRATRFTGPYAWLKLLAVAKGAASETDAEGRTVLPLRARGNPAVTKNLVHIDYVVNAMLAILLAPQAHGRTYHLTHHRPPTLSVIDESFRETLKITGTRFVDAASFEQQPASDLERVFAEQLGAYAAYLHREPSFDKSTIETVLPPERIPLCPEMDLEALNRLFRYAVLSRWGRKKVPFSDAAPTAAAR